MYPAQTESAIEIRVERMTDRADRAYMTGGMTDAEYRTEMARISAWADAQYNAMRESA